MSISLSKKSFANKTMPAAFAFAFLLLLFSEACVAQQPKLKFRHINHEKGLSNSTIECMYQDKRGFIWFGTRDGLNRFDGYGMAVYKNISTDTNSLSDNYIRNIFEDHEGYLWIATYNGVNRFDPSTNRFKRYQHDPAIKGSLSNNAVNFIYEDRKGTVWVSTYGGGLNALDKKTGRFIQFRKNLSVTGNITDDHVNCIAEDRRGNFWVGTDNGLHLMNRDDQTFYLFQDLSNPERIAQNNRIRSIQEDAQGNLWLGTENSGILKFNYQKKSFTHFEHSETDPRSLANNMVKAVLADSKGNIWVGSINGGLDLLDPQTNTFYHYQNEPDDPSSLSQRTVSALLEDREANLWVGTHRGGVNFYNPTAEKFKLFRQSSSANSLSYNDVKAFCEDSKGNIWVGTDGGVLDMYERKQNLFRSWRYHAKDNTTIGSDEVLHIMEDSHQLLWIATWGGGLNSFDRNTGKFTRYKNDPDDNNSISSNYIQKTIEDADGNLWVATYYGGLNFFDRKTKKFTRITDGNNKTQLNGNNIVSLEKDKDGNIWIGTDDGGLNFLNIKTRSFRHYFNKNEKFPDLRVIFFDHKDRLWIGQRGLWVFDPNRDQFFLYPEKAGLAEEFIKGITEDDAGNFWVATANGITRFHPGNSSFKKYNTADGLQGMEFEANAFLKTKDGEMYFGGINGFNSFYPQTISSNKSVPPVYITDFQIFNKKIDPGVAGSPLDHDISMTREIHLSYDQSTVSFNFAALNYTSSENNQYAYKLEHFNDEWTYAGNERKATYTNLDPGEYVFHVKASNNDGVWNESGATIRLVITPPYWDTLWFRSVVAIIMLAAVYIFLRNKRRSELKKIETDKREEMHQVQLQFFTNISHEFRTPLTLITGPLEKLLKDDVSPVSANHYHQMMYRNARRLLTLINELMDFRKVEAGVLKLKVMPGNLSFFLKELSEDFTEIAIQKHIRFHTNIQTQREEVWFDRQVLEKIILNLLNNSFKYTSAEGEIMIELLSSMDNFKPAYTNELIIKNEYRAKKCMFIRVADNGIGISGESIKHLFERYYRINDAHLGSGVGLAFVKSLTALHKGDIYVYSDSKKGTEILIALPVDAQDYTQEEKWVKDQTHVRLESIISEERDHPIESASIAFAVGKLKPSHELSHILIVDDNEELRNFLRESLEPDYHISEAPNGYVGYIKAKEELPDLVISDIMMPVMDGTEFCKQLKEDIDTSHIPFIMLTAKAAIAANIEGMESGADHYFAKPLNTDLLKLTIRNSLQQRKKLKERFTKEYYAEARELAHSTKDKEFMEQLMSIIESQLVNPDLDVDYLCSQVGMSRTKLYQKIKAITGQSIGEFIRTIRLKKAAHIMTHEDLPLSEVMYRIGIQTQSYFTKAFKKEFGKTPSQFMQELKA
ncbi:MAG: two-component regulator propeller domain-containing protein [Flavisolibacter sp.]